MLSNSTLLFFFFFEMVKYISKVAALWQNHGQPSTVKSRQAVFLFKCLSCIFISHNFKIEISKSVTTLIWSNLVKVYSALEYFAASYMFCAARSASCLTLQFYCNIWKCDLSSSNDLVSLLALHNTALNVYINTSTCSRAPFNSEDASNKCNTRYECGHRPEWLRIHALHSFDTLRVST